MRQNNRTNWRSLVKNSSLSKEILKGAGYLRGPGVAILRYHSIRETPDELDGIIGAGLVHSAEIFEQQMKILAMDYQPVDMDDLPDFATGRVRIPRRAVAVTFDDGFADNLEVAAPIMSSHGIRGAVYVTTGSIAPSPPPWFYRVRRVFRATQLPAWTDPHDGKRFDLTGADGRHQALVQACKYCTTMDLTAQLQWVATLESALEVASGSDTSDLMLSEVQIRSLRDGGHIVGAHSVSHPNIAKVSEERIAHELVESKRVLEGILGAEVWHFSYPSPNPLSHYTPRSLQISRDAGYRTGVTNTYGLFIAGDDPLVCRRLSAPMEIQEFHWRLVLAFAHFRREALFPA